MKKTSAAVAHLLLAASLSLLTLAIVDRFNSAMAFIDHNLTKRVLFAVAVVAAIYALIMALLSFAERKGLKGAGLIVYFLAAAVLLIFLAMDYSEPKQILFSKMPAKITVFAFAALGIINSIVEIYVKRDSE